MNTLLQKLSTTYFLKFFLREDWVLAMRDSFLTTSMNLLMGSSPILLRMSQSTLTSWVCRKASSAVLPAPWGLQELVPNTRVWVTAKLLLALIFLFMLTISSLSTDYLSFNSSMQTVSLSTVSFRSSFASGRSSCSFLRQSLTMFLSQAEYCSGRSIVYYPLTIFLAMKRGLLPEKGVFKAIISYMMQPRLQISAFQLQVWFWTICGQEQTRVPTKELLALRDCDMPLARPKSATLRLFLLSTMMLLGLRSRWITNFQKCKYLSTDRREIRNLHTMSSSKQTPFQFWFLMSSERLHPLTTYMTMNRYQSSMKDSQNLMILGCLSYLQIFTSLKQSSNYSFFYLLFFLIYQTLSRLRAYSLDPFLARQTQPKAPWPNYYSRLQLPTTYSLKFLFFIILPIFQNQSSMASTFELSSSSNAFSVFKQASGGFTKWPMSKKGPSSSGGKILLNILRFFYSEQTQRRSLSIKTLNYSKACDQCCSSISQNLIMWQLRGWQRTSRPIASSRPSQMYLLLMSLSSMR